MIVGSIKGVRVIHHVYEYKNNREVAEYFTVGGRHALKATVADLLVFVQQTDGSYRIQAVPARLTDALRLAGRIK